MSKQRFVGVVFVLAFAGSIQAARAEEGSQRWNQLSRIRPGERIAVTTAQGEQAVLFVGADSSSLLITDLTTVPDEHTRKAISRALRDASAAAAAGQRDVNGVKFRVIRLEKQQVQRVTRRSERGSSGVTLAATAAAAAGGLFLGAWAGVAVDGGVLGPDRGGSLAFFGVAIAVPTAVGLAVHSATKRPYTEMLYLAPPPVPLNQADWQAVQEALPASLRQAGHKP